MNKTQSGTNVQYQSTQSGKTLTHEQKKKYIAIINDWKRKDAELAKRGAQLVHTCQGINQRVMRISIDIKIKHLLIIFCAIVIYLVYNNFSNAYNLADVCKK